MAGMGHLYASFCCLVKVNEAFKFPAERQIPLSNKVTILSSEFRTPELLIARIRIFVTVDFEFLLLEHDCISTDNGSICLTAIKLIFILSSCP